jgi:hypothetical protein
MEMVSVSSSNIREIGYDEENEVLGVVFHSGTLYHYQGVSLGTFEELRDAPSVGKFFNANIKGDYECENMGAA